MVTGVAGGTWNVGGGALTGSASAAAPALRLADLGAPLAANAYLEITAAVALTAGARAGIVYDFYSASDYKFVVLDQATQTLVFGHVVGGRVVVDETVRCTLTAGVTYNLVLTIKGASVSAQLNGAFIRSRSYNAALADGTFGLYVAAGSAKFDSFRARTDGYRVPAP